MGGVKATVCRDPCGHPFADTPFVWGEQGSFYRRRLRDGIDASTVITEGGPKLQRWHFDQPYTSMHLVRGGTHQTRALEFEICQKTSVRNSILVWLHNLER